LDAFSRRVIGWALERTLEAKLTMTALKMALSRRKVKAGLVHHSDRGVDRTVSTLVGEVTRALRRLRQSPVFATFAILSLVLGIAANVAIFSIVNGVLLKPLAFADPGRLFGIIEIVPKIPSSIQCYR
ncbi:MAG TPA: hypothetical protein VLI55_20660, partial [Bryobacteraceae bacterium]|nr:hypothetical protein [Bryobacteraceae bacterium]